MGIGTAVVRSDLLVLTLMWQASKLQICQQNLLSWGHSAVVIISKQALHSSVNVTKQVILDQAMGQYLKYYQ
jgi:hypothetical protein